MKQVGEFSPYGIDGVTGFKSYVLNGVEVTIYKRWAVNLMKREASGDQLPQISRDSWREVLCYAKDQDAKKAMESMNSRIAEHRRS